MSTKLEEEATTTQQVFSIYKTSASQSCSPLNLLEMSSLQDHLYTHYHKQRLIHLLIRPPCLQSPIAMDLVEEDQQKLGESRRQLRPPSFSSSSSSTPRESKLASLVRKVLLGFRVTACLVSFSVMVADREIKDGLVILSTITKSSGSVWLRM